MARDSRLPMGGMECQLIAAVEGLPTEVHEQLLPRSWALLDIAQQLIDTRDVTLGDSLIDMRDAFIADF